MRLGLLRLQGRPRLLWSGYMPNEQVDELAEGLRQRGEVHHGGLDFMYATGWQVAWTSGDSGLPRIFDRRGLRTEVLRTPEGTRVRIKRRNLLLGSERWVDEPDVMAVVAEGYADRARSRVLLRLRSGDEVPVAASWDLGAPWADDPWAIRESWTVHAGRALSEALAAPLYRRGDV